MRHEFQQNLDDFTADLVAFGELDGRLLHTATEALLRADASAAEQVLGASEEVAARRESCERRAFELLALQAPVAKDLRQVVSGLYAVEHLDRMAALVGHVATTARLRHPAPVLPEAVADRFAEMARVDAELNARMCEVLSSQDAELAMTLHRDDTAVDEIRSELIRASTAAEWPHGHTAAVDVAMLSRYYERYADHTVSVAGRIVYLVTGEMPGRLPEYDEASILE